MLFPLTSEPLGGGWEGEGQCAVSFPNSSGGWDRCQGVVYEALYGPEETRGVVVGLCEKCYMAAETVAADRFAIAAESFPGYKGLGWGWPGINVQAQDGGTVLVGGPQTGEGKAGELLPGKPLNDGWTLTSAPLC